MLQTIKRLALATLLAGGTALPVQAAPAADLWPRWQAHDAASTATIDHTAWAAFLDAYLVVRPDGANLMRYGEVGADGRRKLDAYLDRLAGVEISRYSRPVQFAYWVNLYNALTVDVVLAHYPVESIRDIDISPGWFANGPWGAEVITVEGAALTLNDIEHRILRPIWQDPRIHYAVNCASIGCPDLRAEPYTADRLDRQLDAAARAYVNDPRGAEVADGALTVSKIYIWYQEDFGGSDAGVIRHLRQYADAELEAQLDGISRIADSRYDWSLNDAPARGGS
ncbi:DUF547 domain-containing protein [Rhodovibrio sodomensis]|uniref:DUF547 domain-containing protein n=1 Tax=Rhodovibrio sodomensis TaxID=1088 RepID=A0ABS1DGV0_9PROT|nr:DUF547 domain-containing protein [Rhodovibrio sodomensis]MBK1668748.1 DUF547 domain-containing protein [Rhodovibrio sodomensis]